MNAPKCLEGIEKEDIANMGFDELKVFIAEVNKEVETERMRQFLLNTIDIRDAESDCRVLDFTKGAK